MQIAEIFWKSLFESRDSLLEILGLHKAFRATQPMSTHSVTQHTLSRSRASISQSVTQHAISHSAHSQSLTSNTANEHAISHSARSQSLSMHSVTQHAVSHSACTQSLSMHSVTQHALSHSAHNPQSGLHPCPCAAYTRLQPHMRRSLPPQRLSPLCAPSQSGLWMAC